MFNHFSKKQYKDEENPYWLSFSDAISGLLIIFILATVYLMYEMQQREKHLSEQVNADITNIQKKLKQSGILVEIDDNIMRIPTSEIHFRNNDANIPEDKKNNVIKIGKEVIDYILKNNQNLDTVFIEGHTDCNPSYRDNRGNMGLSTDRAISVAQEWAKIYKKFWEITNKDGKPLFSVSGYGEHRPILGTMLGDCKNESTENLRKNRRIDIRFVVGKPDIKIYGSSVDERRL